MLRARDKPSIQDSSEKYLPFRCSTPLTAKYLVPAAHRHHQPSIRSIPIGSNQPHQLRTRPYPSLPIRIVCLLSCPHPHPCARRAHSQISGSQLLTRPPVPLQLLPKALSQLAPPRLASRHHPGPASSASCVQHTNCAVSDTTPTTFRPASFLCGSILSALRQRHFPVAHFPPRACLAAASSPVAHHAGHARHPPAELRRDLRSARELSRDRGP